MSLAAPTRPVAQPDRAADARTHPGPDRRADLLVALVCLAGAVYLTWGLWADPNHRVITHNQGDQALFEWLLSYQAHAVTTLTNPLWTTLLNTPLGANLAVNTSTVLVGTVLAPITLVLGAPVAVVVALTANLALSPYAWYHVLSRHVTRTRAAAVLGALFCGFAPGIVSHANGHLNFTAGFLLPLIAWRVVSLARSRRPARAGAVLGILVVAEFSLGAEMLFFWACGCGVFVGLWALWHKAAARALAPAFLRGLGACAAVGAVILSYPLYLQFAGPQRYQGIGFDQRIHAEDLASYVSFPYLSVARLAGLWFRLAPNYTEETTFFGPVLLLLIVACAVVLWRRRWIRALALTGLVFAVLSLGPWLRLGGTRTSVPLPFGLLWRLPVFDAALPARLALVVIPIAGILLALGMDRALDLPVARRRVWLAAFVVALLPLVPLGIPTTPRAAVPHFFTSNTWRSFVHSGQTLVPVPPASDLLPDGQRWQAAAGFGFAIPAGFFLGPGPGGRSQIGPDPRPTAALLTEVARYGTAPRITSADREQARIDLAYWNASLIVLSDGGEGSGWTPNQPALLRTATELFGQPQRIDDVWVWRV